MSGEQEKSINIGCNWSFFGFFAVLFIGLKLTSQIDWPWLWVLSPVWLPIAVPAAILLAMSAVATVILIIILPVIAVLALFDRGSK